jgi:hypothetical protein
MSGAPLASIVPIPFSERPIARPQITISPPLTEVDDRKEDDMSLPLRLPIANEQTQHVANEPESEAEGELEYDDGLIAVAGPIMIACYLVLFLVAATAFHGTGTALLSVMLSATLGVVYFGIPLLLMQIRAGRDVRWRSDPSRAHSSEVDVWTGSMRRWEAIVQIVTIPLAIVMGFTLLAVRWSML